MQSIVAALLLMLGGGAQAEAQPTLDDWIRAAEQARQAAVHAERGSSGIPMIEKNDPQPDAPKVRGIYATAHSAGGARLDTLLTLIDDTELNSLVVDVKDDYGYITYPTTDPELAARGTAKNIIRDPAALLGRLSEHDVYPIARVVVFKDSVLAEARPDLSFVGQDGAVWKNGRGEAFVNPYRKEVWEYNIQVAKDAAKLGFKEIQFDYVRFPEGFEKKADILDYHKDERRRIEVVADFVKYAREQLEPLGVRVSVDIFGYAASVPAAEGIGQDFEAISKYVDVICPMIYPSHYTAGWFGSAVPDAAPYVTIDGAMKDTHEKLEPLGPFKPIIRPWIQDFTASWVKGYIKYGKREVEEQIRALMDNGVDEFLLWNANNRYTQGVDYDLQ
ncbi:putative glycoside hydrolase [Paenibacillus sp.]|uniref:putative glycoside hydrolase n=1 Tax=Paenibacillus sp. TaxID=58172 RepID=UPI002D369DB8|nr:putative glycoside hydrolase [Paenibacillus sp.]HZG87223.1 putative glycoside hydrolase [Paenibacillus sp.]